MNRFPTINDRVSDDLLDIANPIVQPDDQKQDVQPDQSLSTRLQEGAATNLVEHLKIVEEYLTSTCRSNKTTVSTRATLDTLN